MGKLGVHGEQTSSTERQVPPPPHTGMGKLEHLIKNKDFKFDHLKMIISKFSPQENWNFSWLTLTLLFTGRVSSKSIHPLLVCHICQTSYNMDKEVVLLHSLTWISKMTFPLDVFSIELLYSGPIPSLLNTLKRLSVKHLASRTKTMYKMNRYNQPFTLDTDSQVKQTSSTSGGCFITLW